MDFKGTIGKWVFDFESKMIKTDNESIASVWSQDTNYLDERLENESWLDMRKRTKEERKTLTEEIPRYNGLLMSKAPEMLEMLKKCKIMCDNLNIHHVSNELNALINEATEL